MGSRGEAPDGICKIIPQDGIFIPSGVAPAGVTVFPDRKPRFWYPICSAGGAIDRILSPRPGRGK